MFNKNKTELILCPLGKKVTSYTVPSTVKRINSYAFTDHEELKSLTIGKGLTKIGYSAFLGCDRLKDVYYKGSQAQWEEIDISYHRSDPLNFATIHYNA